MTASMKQSGAPAALPPSATTTMVDAYDEPHVTLTLRVTVTRDQLAGALDFAAAGSKQSPDSWTTEQIRNWTESSIALMDCLELQQAGEGMAALAFGPIDGDASLVEPARAVYRAVDRAYPASGETGREVTS